LSNGAPIQLSAVENLQIICRKSAEKKSAEKKSADRYSAVLKRCFHTTLRIGKSAHSEFCVNPLGRCSKYFDRVQISRELHLRYFKDPNIYSSNLSANESHFSNLTPSIIFHILGSKNITEYVIAFRT
jgi:hypothetical protein